MMGNVEELAEEPDKPIIETEEKQITEEKAEDEAVVEKKIPVKASALKKRVAASEEGANETSKKEIVEPAKETSAENTEKPVTKEEGTE